MNNNERTARQSIAIRFEKATMRGYDAYALISVARLASGNRREAAQDMVIEQGIGFYDEDGMITLF